MGDQLRRAMGLSSRPDHFGDLIDAWVAIADRDGLEIDPDVLCSCEKSPHKATVEGKVEYYRCVQDPIFLPFLSADVEEVAVHTASPVSGSSIELTVTPTAIEVEPAETLFSFGVKADVEEPPAAQSPILAHEAFCPYGHAFVSREEYDNWASTVDAYTMVIPVETMYDLARAVGKIVS
ncbi:MAG: organomercurial lyase, partial [Halobacteriales archaeon]|nr:organomercurial lyase [Halobacteriales archaeon]